jgi:hypothetical protein
LAAAISTALERLRAGEGRLAVHPQCGTNVSTGIVLAGLASYAALRGKQRSRLEKVLQLAFGLGAALTLAQPLGMRVQEHITTSTEVTALQVVDIRRLQRGRIIVHRIDTKWE